MFAAVGLPVEELHRRRYGPIVDKGLEPGGYRELSGDEVEALRRAGEEVAAAVASEVEGEPVLLAAEAPVAAVAAAPATPDAAVRATAESPAPSDEPDGPADEAGLEPPDGPDGAADEASEPPAESGAAGEASGPQDGEGPAGDADQAPDEAD